jgi:hypothetical protein
MNKIKTELKETGLKFTTEVECFYPTKNKNAGERVGVKRSLQYNNIATERGS